MRNRAVLPVLLFCANFLPAQQSAKEREQYAWITKAIVAAQAIHPGMHRRDLDASFKGEGGLSTRTERTYVWRECVYVKIQVEFTPVAADSPSENPEDTISRVSEPYLQFSITD